jgi:hypothetical protein
MFSRQAIHFMRVETFSSFAIKAVLNSFFEHLPLKPVGQEQNT